MAELTARAGGDLDFRRLTADGLEGADLERAHAAVRTMRAALPPDLRTEDGRDLLAILDEALAYGCGTGRAARIEPVLGPAAGG